uniref:PX domain-containing protein n=1 Tax=Xiphophorus couchianus TaxID=32473 RepID=A0A3B5MXZ0_9TELE
MNEATSVLSVYGHTIKVTEVSQDGDTLTFIIVSQKLSGTGEYHVDRTYDDFEWLQQHLFAQEEVPGIQGVIFPPLPARPQVNASAKVMKQLGKCTRTSLSFLGLGEWQPYCKALETFLRQVAAHSILSKNKAVEVFLTSTEPPGRQKVRRNIFNRLSQAVEEMRKEGHKVCIILLNSLASSLNTLSACRVCVKLSEVFDSIKKNMMSIAVNDMNTLGLGLDLDSRYQEAEKEMLFRRTCKLVELENARKNAEKAKPVKKNADYYDSGCTSLR